MTRYRAGWPALVIAATTILAAATFEKAHGAEAADATRVATSDGTGLLLAKTLPSVVPPDAPVAPAAPASTPTKTPAEPSRPAAPTPTGTAPAGTRIVASLTDGSRIVGTPVAERVDVHTEHGDIQLRWADIRSVEWKPDDRNAKFDLANGDTVAGSVTATSVELKTIFGQVTIPMVHIRRLTVAGAAAASSLRFDGRQNYVSVPSNSALDPTEAMTLEFWFKTTTRGGHAIVGKRKWMPTNQWPGPDDHGYQLHIQGGTLIAYWEGSSLFGRPAADGKWHYAALTWDGTNRRLFQDGVLVAKDTPRAWKPAEIPLRIGGVHGVHPGADFFEGTISQVRLSNVDRYKGQNFAPPTCFDADTDTVACWDFSEGGGTALYDQAGNGHDGSLMGDPLPQWEEDAPTGVPAAGERAPVPPPAEWPGRGLRASAR
jgi:hypothetical protein